MYTQWPCRRTSFPSHSEKTLGTMKAERTVKRITFNPSEANPGETLYVSVPKLSDHEVIVSGSLALVFNISLSGGHANNYLVYFNPDITKVKVTVNGVPNRVYNEGISGSDMWNELTRYFNPHTHTRTRGSHTPNGGRPNITLAKYLTGNKFGLWIDLRSMADTTLHGNGQRLVNTQDGAQLKIERTASGSGNTNCHVFTISDSQMNIMQSQLESVQY